MRALPTKHFIFTLLLLLHTPLLWSSDCCGTCNKQNHGYLTGLTSHDAILQERKFKEQYQQCTPSKQQISYLQKVKKDIHMSIVFGDWCSDSQKEVPQLMKLIDKTKNKHIAVSYIAISKDKKRPAADIVKYKIEYVPTVIITQGKKEIARFVGTPKENWGTAINNIFNNKGTLENKNKRKT